jgi:translation elongation factor EF-Tu-like GTPase
MIGIKQLRLSSAKPPRRSTSSLGSTMSAYAFVDLLSHGRHSSVRIRATISMLSRDQGGRATGIRSGYRPNHNFGGAENRQFYIGQVDLGSREFLNPGDSQEVLIEFLHGPGIEEAVKAGATWRIQEGPQLIAVGTVIEVLGET